MSTLEQRIKALEEKLKQQKAKKALIEARKRAALAKVKRAQDTRRKILVGAVVLAKVESGEYSREQLLRMLDEALTRDDDRALFDLAKRADSASTDFCSEH